MANGESRFVHIQNQARADGQNVSDLARLYTLEGMLARIAASVYVNDFVLKGGVLLAAFVLRRPTKDIENTIGLDVSFGEPWGSSEISEV